MRLMHERVNIKMYKINGIVGSSPYWENLHGMTLKETYTYQHRKLVNNTYVIILKRTSCLEELK